MKKHFTTYGNNYESILQPMVTIMKKHKRIWRRYFNGVKHNNFTLSYEKLFTMMEEGVVHAHFFLYNGI